MTREIFKLEPEPGRECCDFLLFGVGSQGICQYQFCNTLGPVVTHESIGAWAACSECARLIDGNRWSELTERALAEFNRIHGYTPAEEAFFRNKFHEIHLLFRDHMIKEV